MGSSSSRLVQVPVCWDQPQASLRGTARPVRYSSSGYEIGVLHAKRVRTGHVIALACPLRWRTTKNGCSIATTTISHLRTSSISIPRKKNRYVLQANSFADLLIAQTWIAPRDRRLELRFCGSHTKQGSFPPPMDFALASTLLEAEETFY